MKTKIVNITRIKNFIGRKSPDFLLRIFIRLEFYIGHSSKYRFLKTILLKKILAKQIPPIRHQYMKKAISMALRNKKDFRLLEIGSWGGDSAILWGEHK